MRSKNGVFSLAMLAMFMLSACGNNSNINNTFLPVNNAEPVHAAFKPESDAIARLIKAKTIASNEWGIQVNQLPITKQLKKATLLSYLAFDNDKGGWRNEIPQMINMHEKAGSSSILNQVILADGAEQSDVKRYYIVNDKNNEKIVSPYVQSKREFNSGDYMSLAAFTKWGFSNFPSRIKILDINNHGNAYDGIAFDETSGSHISTPELAKAIKNGAGKVDILNLDACLMSTIEVAYQLKDVVDIMVSSEDKTLRTGMNYAQYLPEIINNSTSNKEIAEKIMELSDREGQDVKFSDEPDAKVPNVYTISAIKASDTDRLVHHLNKLSRMLLNKLPVYKRALWIALDKTHQPPVDQTDKTDMGQRDLYEVLGLLELELNELRDAKVDPEIRNTIQNVREAANRAVIRARNHKSQPWSEGIAINISPDTVVNAEYKNTTFAKDTLWDELIVAVNNPVRINKFNSDKKR